MTTATSSAMLFATQRPLWQRCLLFCVLFGVLMPALAQEPTLEELLREGDIYYTRGDCQLSQFIFQEALEQAPDSVPALLGQGRALVCQGAFDLGIAAYQQALSLDSRNLVGYVRLASAYLAQYNSNPEQFSGNLDQALSALGTAQSIDPNDARVLNTRGIILYQLGDYEQARDALAQAAANAGGADLSALDRSRIQVNLGRSYRALRQSQLALEAFREAVTLDPTNFEARNYLGETLFVQGNCEQGVFELRQAANLAPDDLASVANLGIALFECGQVDAALTSIEQALALDGVSIPALYTYLARVYLEQGRIQEAVREAQKGALLPPTSAEALYWLGQAYEAAGNMTAARESYQRGLDIDPNSNLIQNAVRALN
jgi:tetratricopeptide (TPR) repeat protein